MDKEVVEVIAAIPIGVVIKWISFVIAAIAGTGALAIKTYKVFEKYKSIKDEKENLQKTVKQHETKLVEFDSKLTLIINMLNSQNETTMKQLRSELVKDGERYLVEKKMTIREWKVYMEKYNEYHDKFNQNSYVESLRNKIEREVQIVGALDEHGNDIEK